MPGDLAARLAGLPGSELAAHLADLHGIERAVALYAHVIDERRWAELDEVYAPDAVLDLSAVGHAPRRGLDAIAAFLRDEGAAPAALVTTNVVIDLEPGATEATGRARWLAVRASGAVAAGTYDDRYTKLPEGWRIAARRPRRL